MPELAKAALFAAFVACAVYAGTRRGDDGRRRTRVSALVALGMVLSLGPGLSGREAWPFSSWAMDNAALPADFRFLEAIVVDSQGVEHAADARAFEPMAWVDLSTWLARTREGEPARFDSVATWVLGRLRAARDVAARGDDIGTNRRWLGPLAAPPTQLAPKVWRAGARELPSGIAAWRVYEVRVNLDAPRRAPTTGERTLVFEFPRP